MLMLRKVHSKIIREKFLHIKNMCSKPNFTMVGTNYKIKDHNKVFIVYYRIITK